MTNVAGFRTISPAEPPIACASLDNDDNDGFSGSVSSAPQGGKSDDSRGDKKLDSPERNSSSTSGAVQQICSGPVDKRDRSGSPSLGEDNTPVARMGWCSGSADQHKNRNEEISDGWAGERVNGTVGTGHRPETHACTKVRTRPCLPALGKGHVNENKHVNGQGHSYRPVYKISEEVASAAAGASVHSTRRYGGAIYEERPNDLKHGSTAVPTTTVVPYPRYNCVALEGHRYSPAADREASRGSSGREEGGVWGWERRRPVGTKKPVSPASPRTTPVSVFATGETKRDRYPLRSPAESESLHEAHVEGSKGGHQEQVSEQTTRPEVAEVVATPPSSASKMLSSNKTVASSSHRSPPQRGNEARAESEGRRTICSSERSQQRREFMRDAAADSEGSRSGQHSSTESDGDGPVAEGDESDNDSGQRIRVFKAAEKQDVAAAAAAAGAAGACGSGEDTDDEPLSVAARKKTDISRPLSEEDSGESRSTASTCGGQSDRWTVLQGSIPKLKDAAPGNIREASPTSDSPSRRGDCSTTPQFSSYILKPSAPFPVQSADGGSLPTSPSDKGCRRRLTIPAVDGFDGSAIASGESRRDSRGFSDEGHGGYIRAAAEPDRSMVKVDVDTTIARQTKEEGALSDDTESRSSMSPREESPATTVTASRKRDAEAADSARVPEQDMTQRYAVCADRVVNKSPPHGRGDTLESKRESEEDALRSVDVGRRDSRVSSGGCRSSISSSCSGSIGAPDVDEFIFPAISFVPRARKLGEDLSSGSGVEKAAAALAAVPTAAKAAEMAMSGCRPIIPGVPPGAIVDDAETSAGEDCPVEVVVRDSGEVVYSFKKSGRPRRGKWSRLEEEFAKRIINDFDDGVLDAQPGIGLRQLLATKLRCEVMRVSKKFSGWACVGKRSFRPMRYQDGRAARAQASLYALEQRWLKTFVPSSTLPAKPPALEPSIVSRPSVPSTPRSLIRLVPAPPAVEGDGGVASLAKIANHGGRWVDRAKKTLSGDISVNPMEQRYVSEPGREGGNGGGGPIQGYTPLLGYGAGQTRAMGEHFPPTIRPFSNVEEARQYHSIKGGSRSVRGYVGENMPANGSGHDEAAAGGAEVQWRHASIPDKSTVVGNPHPSDSRQQHHKEIEFDSVNKAGSPRIGREQKQVTRYGPVGGEGVVGGASRPDVFATLQPSPSARHHPWPDGDARRPDDGQERRGNSYLGWGAARQLPYARHQQSGVQERRTDDAPAAYDYAQDGNNHGHDKKMGRPRDVYLSWQQRRHQNAHSSGAINDTGATSARAVGAVEDASSKTTTPATGSIGGGGWARAPVSSLVAGKQGTGRVKAVRPQQPRSPCTISRPNGDVRSTLAAASEASRSDNYPHFRKQLVSPGDSRGEKGALEVVLNYREHGSGPAYPSPAWHHDTPSLSRPESDVPKSAENGDGRPRAEDPTARRPGPFRLKPPTSLPPHLRVEHNGMSFFPGDGCEAVMAAENRLYAKRTPPLHQQLDKNSVQRLPVDEHRLGGSICSDVEHVPVEKARGYSEDDDATVQHRHPFKSRRIEVDGGSRSSRSFGLEGDQRYSNGYRQEYPEKSPPSDSGDFAVKPVVNGSWRPNAVERDLATQDAYAASSVKPAGRSGAPSVQDPSPGPSSSRAVDIHPHNRRNNFASSPAGVRVDGWDSSSGPQESHLRPMDRGLVVPAGDSVVLRVEASPDSRRSSACDGSPGVVRKPFIARRN